MQNSAGMFMVQLMKSQGIMGEVMLTRNTPITLPMRPGIGNKIVMPTMSSATRNWSSRNEIGWKYSLKLCRGQPWSLWLRDLMWLISFLTYFPWISYFLYIVIKISIQTYKYILKKSTWNWVILKWLIRIKHIYRFKFSRIIFCIRYFLSSWL